jgi:hypothetical protein
MSGKRKRLSKKECKRLKRERAEEEAKTRSESEYRQGRIKVLWQQLQSGDLAKVTDKELAETELVRSLVELVALQRDEIEYMRPGHELCEWAKTHTPNELAALREKHREKDPFARVLRAVLAQATKLTPKQASEWRTRSGRRREEVGLVEYEFGGQAEARAGFPYDPTCLDDILMGDGVTMEHLEILFGMERHRFPEKLPSVRDKRKIRYSALAVVKIMDALLREKLPERKPQAHGGSVKKLWLSDPDRQKRVLMGIASRAYALSKDRGVLAAFMAVVCRHLAIGYPKERLPEGFEDCLDRVGRRYLD